MASKRKELFLKDSIISLILVTQNDEDIIKDILQEVINQLIKLKIGIEIIVVDNDSDDETITKIRSLQNNIPYIRILRLSKQYDKDIAITAGLDNCIGDYAIVFDHYTSPSDTITLLFEKLLQQNDIVIGKEKNGYAYYSFFSKIFLSITQNISTHQFTYTHNYLFGLSRRAINSIMQIRRKSRSLSYINYLIGFQKAEIYYQPIEKYTYKLKKENFFKVVLNVTNIIISNSFKPMRILSFLGMFTSLSFLFYVFAIAIIKIIFNIHLAPEGWITLGTVLGLMFLILFSFLSIISEYIIRILDETRNEPFYFIADEIDKSIILPKKNLLNVL